MNNKRENVFYSILGTLGLGILLFIILSSKDYYYQNFDMLLFLTFIVTCIVMERLSLKIGKFIVVLDSITMISSYFILGLIPTLWLILISFFVADIAFHLRSKIKMYSNIGMFILIYTIAHYLLKLVEIEVGSFSEVAEIIFFGIMIYLLNWILLGIQAIISNNGSIPEGMVESFKWDFYGNLIIIPLTVFLVLIYSYEGYFGVVLYLIFVIVSNIMFKLLRNLIFMNKELKIIQEISLSINSGLELHETTANILRGINELVVSDYSAIIGFNKETLELKTLDYNMQTDINITSKEFSQILADNIEVVVKAKKSFIVEDLTKNEHQLKGLNDFDEVLKEIESFVYEPLVLEDEIIGFLLLCSKSKNKFRKEHLKILDILANQAVVAIQNAHLYREVRNKAMTDSLTGLYNQRYFFEVLNSITNEKNQHNGMENEKKVSLIIFDIDHFKKINDTYGHQTGDEILKEIAKIIRNNVREEDIVSRYGGEEFTIILPRTSQEIAYQVGERIRYVIEQSEFKSINDDKIKLTISGGISEYPFHADSSARLLAYADREEFTILKFL